MDRNGSDWQNLIRMIGNETVKVSMVFVRMDPKIFRPAGFDQKNSSGAF
jgi:hypothetical protein